MKRIFAIMALFALVLTSCEKDEAIVIGSGLDTITATIEATADTKASLNENNTKVEVKWNDYDAISVFYKIDNEITNVKYNLSAGAGTGTATFTKDQTETDDLTGATMLAAVYPYTEDAVFVEANSTISGMTASVDKYPMAYLGAGPQISFKNAGALVQVKTGSIPYGVNTLILSSESKGIAGSYTISFDNEGNPNTKSTATSKKYIEYTSSESLADRTIYFPIFVDSYTDLTVTAKDNSTSYTVVAPKALTTKRNYVHYTSAGVTSVSTTYELIEAVNSNSTNIYVIVGPSIKDIELPASTDKTITLVIENITDNISITTQSGKSVSSKINLVFKDRSVTDKTLTITLPDATVELSGNATFANIISSTASNTLILGAGITATKVTVIKGNIQVDEGATLNGVSTELNEPVVVIDNGGTISNEVTSDPKVSEIDYDAYPAYMLQQAATNGGTYTLTEDLELSETLVIPSGKTFTLNLNGKTISHTKACTASYSMIENKGTLTINGNGKISFTDNGSGDPSFGWGSYTLTNYGTLEVNNVTVENLSTQNPGNGQDNVHMYCAIQQGHGAVSTTINSGVISTPTYRSVRINTGALIIKGGTLNGQVWLQPNQGDVTLNISGGVFSPCGNDGSSLFMTNTGENYTVTSAIITGGTFKTKIGSSDPTKEGVKGSVKGGIFTETAKTNTNASLIAEGYDFELNTDNNTYTLMPAFIEVSANNYEIYNVSGLMKFADAVNVKNNSFNGCTVTLVNDLDLKNTAWSPVGQTGATQFMGTFNGSDKTISNLNIDATAQTGKLFKRYFRMAECSSCEKFKSVNCYG